ncbi:BlaI/MecI/CopY family transcriptional regulator [Anaeromicrobium sediminis]|uniref:Transcriptional regulator n=1 Tax=Anaeromicrobium sediminis TaxID=1478221 RepID=A0A267MHL8_9FIRM|nr:BlaI/MecI/CopY family transcriptional regulator [Anaeromicrobium sediminis]PAB59071.1 transcriptional regulator [Anaeromicrobium sediminis]
MHKNIPKISDSEYEIMKIIWKNHPIKSNDIIQQIDQGHNWSEKTIKTMINRLLKKEVISYKKDGKSYLYYPLVEESNYRKLENESFLKKVYNGSINVMFASFIKDMKLSDKDINELKMILEEGNDDE